MEEAVLGALMLEGNKLIDVMAILPISDCFYTPANQLVYKAILELYRVGLPIDLLTITKELRENNQIDQIGGAYYLTKLTMDVVSSAHIEGHALMIAEKWMKRKQIHIAHQLLSEAYDESIDVFESIDKNILELQQITDMSNMNEPESMEDIYREKLKEIEEFRERGEDIMGASTGISELDEIMNGVRRRKQIVIAARPGNGKTALALQITDAMVEDVTKCTGVGFFSFEMDGKELMERKMANINQIDMSHITKPSRLSGDEMERLICGLNKIPKKKVWIYYGPGLSWLQLRNKVRRLKIKHNISHVVIDYLQLMSDEKATGKGNREQEISTISRKLKEMGMDMDLGIIALCQMSREVEKRTSGRPKLSDLRESGSIEQDADMVMFIYRPTIEEIAQNPILENARTIMVEKNRGGKTGEVDIEWIGSTQTFKSLGNNEFSAPIPEKPNAGFQNAINRNSSQDRKELNEDTPF